MQGKYDDAEPLYERSHAIREKVLGPEHPDVAESLNSRAVLLEKQVSTIGLDFSRDFLVICGCCCARRGCWKGRYVTSLSVEGELKKVFATCFDIFRFMNAVAQHPI